MILVRYTLRSSVDTMRAAVLTILALGLLASSCTTCEDLYHKHPECLRTDTVRDTVRVHVPMDTVSGVVMLYVSDTVYMDTGRLQVKVVRIPTGGPCDTVKVPIFVAAKADSVDQEVPVDKIIYRPTPCPEGERVAAGWKWAAIGFGALLLILVVLGWAGGRLFRR